MAELSTIARPYAEAAFRTAKEGNALPAWNDLVTEMGAVADRPEMRALMSAPKVTADQLYGVFAGVLKSPIDQKGQNFLRLLIENGRLDTLPEIAVQFTALKNAEEGTADAEIVSAYPLSAAQVSELVAGLTRKFKKTLKPHVSVDQDLIGGVRVVVGDHVFDTSIKAQLERMKTTLTA
ncbi:MAG TPA: F0F1 ATP synthase subunit delta [Burkholderiales bacterium]|jgi:F-type H+-transporting ATPase subunit delta